MSLPKKAIHNPHIDPEQHAFLLFQSDPEDFHRIMQRHNQPKTQTQTLLRRVFFHKKNLDLVQKLIIRDVFYRTNGLYLISRQDDGTILETMQSVYDAAATANSDIRSEIARLNELVVTITTPGIVENIKSYHTYLREVGAVKKPIPHPSYAAHKGNRGLGQGLTWI